MATIYTGYRNYTRFYLRWDVAQQDIANNRSLINWTAGIQGQPGINPFWGTNAIRINSVYIDGQGNLASGTWSNITLVDGQTVPLRSGSVWVGHNGDGTKSFSVSVSGWLFANGDIGASGSMTLPTIPRNSQVTTNKSSYTLGEPVTVNTNRKSTTFTHTITLKNAANNATLKTFTNVGGSVTWTPSPTEITTMQGMIPNTNTLNLRVEQWNNQIDQGSNRTVPLNLTDANPIFTDFSYRDSNTAVTAITGDNQILVKGQSTLETVISVENKMEAVKSASEVRYSVVFDGITDQKNYQETTDVISQFTQVSTTGQRTIVATAIDSRGNNTSVSKQVDVYDYVEPFIESSLERENNFGTNTTLHLEGSWTPLVIGGSAKNSILAGTLKYRYKEDGGSFGSWQVRAFTTSGDTWSISSDVVVSLDNTKKYIFEFQISDRFTTVTFSNSVDVGKPIMFTGEKDGEPAVGIGKMPEQAGLDVDGPIYSNGNKVAFGGWDEIARFQGTATTSNQTLTFAPYKYIKVVASATQSGSHTTQGTLRIRLGSTGTSYNRALTRVTSAATTVLAVGTTDSIIMGISRASGQASYGEVEMQVRSNFNGDVALARMASQDIDWLYCTGQYFFLTGTAQMSPLTFYTTTTTYTLDLVVYGHN